MHDVFSKFCSLICKPNYILCAGSVNVCSSSWESMVVILIQARKRFLKFALAIENTSKMFLEFLKTNFLTVSEAYSETC